MDIDETAAMQQAAAAARQIVDIDYGQLQQAAEGVRQLASLDYASTQQAAEAARQLQAAANSVRILARIEDQLPVDTIYTKPVLDDVLSALTDASSRNLIAEVSRQHAALLKFPNMAPISVSSLMSENLSQAIAGMNKLTQLNVGVFHNESIASLMREIRPANMASLAVLSDVNLNKINWDYWKAISAGNIPRSLFDFTATYATLIQSLQVPSRGLELVEAKRSTSEIFLFSDTLANVKPRARGGSTSKVHDVERVNTKKREEISQEVHDIMPQLLSRFGSHVVDMWNGATKVLESDNPDQCRHFLISLRTLVEKVLHELSPDDELRAWSNDEQHFHNGNPTRSARMLFISRHMSESFSAFIKSDIKAHKDFIDLLQRVHQPDVNFDVPTQRLVRTRSGALLQFLIEASEL